MCHVPSVVNDLSFQIYAPLNGCVTKAIASFYWDDSETVFGGLLTIYIPILYLPTFSESNARDFHLVMTEISGNVPATSEDFRQILFGYFWRVMHEPIPGSGRATTFFAKKILKYPGPPLTIKNVLSLNVEVSFQRKHQGRGSGGGGGWRAYLQVSIMACMGRLLPKAEFFSGFRYIWKRRDFNSWSI